jgi:tRNA(fMet)-specific endonuclease VapC
MLDTDIISDLIRNPAGKAAQRVASVGDKAVCTRIFVAGELAIWVREEGITHAAAKGR